MRSRVMIFYKIGYAGSAIQTVMMLSGYNIILAAVIQLVGRTTSFSSDEAVCGLNQTIEFRCLLAPTPPGNPRGFYGFEWKINNVSSISVEGARSNVSSRPPLLLLYCSASLNNSLVQCVRVSLISSTEPPAFGDLHTLHIQGLLESVEDLEISINCTSWSIILTWQPPFSLNITNTDPTITFCVDVYEVRKGGTIQLNDSADHWTESHQYTMNISDLNQYQFIVRARNVVGLGAPSAPINATLLPCFNASLLNARAKICNSQVEMNASLVTSSYLVLSELRVCVHVIANENGMECICRVDDINISLDSDKCGCIIPSANYTIFIEIVEYRLVSNHLFITSIESCEDLTQLGTTSIDVNALTLNSVPTLNRSDKGADIKIIVGSSVTSAIAVLTIVILILSLAGTSYYKKKKTSGGKCNQPPSVTSHDIYTRENTAYAIVTDDVEPSYAEITPNIKMPSANEPIYLNIIPKESQWKQESLQNATTLSVADLFHDLSPIACKWREFAGKMGIDVGSVLEFTGEPTNKNKACLKVTIELLRSWSLADIIKTLKSMEEFEVANYLHRKYCETYIATSTII